MEEGHHGPTRQGARPGGGRALHPRGHVAAPPNMFSVPDILKYSGKIIFSFQGIWRTFIFGVFFIAWIIQKIDEKILFFSLFNINSRK